VKADPRRMLHWDKMLSEQSSEVRAALDSLGYGIESGTGEEIFHKLASIVTNTRDSGEGGLRASEMLRDAGLHGIRYYDAASRDFPADAAEQIKRLKQDVETRS
jgi:hypothetical protein